MSFSGSIPYVYQRGNLFCFRWTLARPLAKILGKRELRRSLATGYKAVALRRAITIAAKLKSLTAEFESMRDITPQNLHVLLDQYFLEALSEREHWREQKAGMSDGEIAKEMTAFEYLRRDTQERLRRHDYSNLGPVIEMLASDWKVNAPPAGTEAFNQLCRGILRTDAKIFEVELRRTAGDYSDAITPVGAISRDVAVHTPPLRLSEAIKLFVAEVERGEHWGERTKIDNNAIFRDLVEIIGDATLSTIKRDALLNYRSAILRMPPRRRNDPKFRDLSIAEILALPDVAPIAVRTANKIFTRVGQFFEWAKDQGRITENPATKLLIKESKKKKKHAARDDFDEEDLRRIFFSEIFLGTYSGKQPRRPYMHWLPLIALFSGSRIEEIASLKVADIYEVNSIPIIDINRIGASGKEKQLKNESSERKIAIHPTLIELGFLEYTDKIKSLGHKALFPELPPRTTGKCGPTASNWFSRYLDSIGLKSRTEVFHSFRHTFINYAKQIHIPVETAKELAGHTGSDVTYDTYGKPLWPSAQLEILRQLDFYGIDFSALKDQSRKLFDMRYKKKK